MRNGKEEGFTFIYWKLSYRRKLIRTLIMTPFVILFLFWYFVRFPDQGALLLVLFAAAVCGLQLWYNYHMMKKVEREEILEEVARQSVTGTDEPQ